jgi:hypothetical protein
MKILRYPAGFAEIRDCPSGNAFGKKTVELALGGRGVHATMLIASLHSIAGLRSKALIILLSATV